MWLRTASKEDIDAIQHLLSESYHAALDDLVGSVATNNLINNVFSLELIKKALTHPSSEYIVADDGDTLHGVAYASHGGVKGDSDAVMVHFLAVRPESQRQGVGRQLLVEIEESFTSARKIRLHVLKSNQNAIKFLEREGYKPLPHALTIEGMAATIMEKPIF